MSAVLLKVLSADGRSIHGGNTAWSLPHGRRPGKWMPAIKGPVVCCITGYHLVGLRDLLGWVRPDCVVYLTEGRGDRDSNDGDKIAYRQARLLRRLAWDDRVAQRYAADVAEHVRFVWERWRPDDPCLRQVIDVARRYADGTASIEELEVAERTAWAASAAASADGSAAANAAACATAWAASAAVRGATAWAANAARGAARDVARDAAEGTARAIEVAERAARAERVWQTALLAQYLGLTAEEVIS